ncbi:MAG: peptidyl-prolyl cis-trans isomerase SurA [Yoonia sp.]|jgi:peptidyl-prolyl cis-trans isomerase SurA
MKSLKMPYSAIVAGIMTCTLMLAGPTASIAQGELATVISVNDRVITQFELADRRRLLALFNTAGDIDRIAREGLIEDRLKQQEMDRFNRNLSEQELQQALEDFAGRANLTVPEFSQILTANNVAVPSFVAYVSVGVLWRDFVRARFSREVTVTNSDVERALSRQGAGSTQLEVLLSEIIIPAPPERAARVQEVAAEISRLRSFSEFESAARQVSALPSRENGGRLDWLPVDNYPPQLRQLLLDLRPGEVTEPIDIPNGVALFQKRGQREANRTDLAPVSLEYAAYYMPGGRSDAALRTAEELTDQVDTCDDLYGIARNQPQEVLDRLTQTPAEISGDIALELARLDSGEVSYNLTSNNGETLVFLMLCARNYAGQGTTDRELISNQIRSQRLSALSDALVADLRAAADIRP